MKKLDSSCIEVLVCGRICYINRIGRGGLRMNKGKREGLFVLDLSFLRRGYVFFLYGRYLRLR